MDYTFKNRSKLQNFQAQESGTPLNLTFKSVQTLQCFVVLLKTLQCLKVFEIERRGFSQISRDVGKG